MLLLINKPLGLTSHDVVDQVRKITGERTVGHAGTLDPLATGLLIVAVGREETKKISQFVGLAKTYEFTVRLGVRSVTQDLEGPFEFAENQNLSAAIFCGQNSSRPNVGRDSNSCPQKLQLPDSEHMGSILSLFIGKQQQRVPAYSAKKVNGKKLYELARRGQEIPERFQGVEIFEIELMEMGVSEFQEQILPFFKIRARVSSGTYIRQLAEDIAAKLGTWGLTENIKRISIGEHRIEQATALDELSAFLNNV